MAGQANPGLPELRRRDGPTSLGLHGPRPPALTLFPLFRLLQDPQPGYPLAPPSSACPWDRSPGEACWGPGVTEALELVGAWGLALHAPGRMMPPTGAPGSFPERPGWLLPWWGAVGPSAQPAPFWVLVPAGVGRGWGGAPAETAGSWEGPRPRPLDTWRALPPCPQSQHSAPHLHIRISWARTAAGSSQPGLGGSPAAPELDSHPGTHARPPVLVWWAQPWPSHPRWETAQPCSGPGGRVGGGDGLCWAGRALARSAPRSGLSQSCLRPLPCPPAPSPGQAEWQGPLPPPHPTPCPVVAAGWPWRPPSPPLVLKQVPLVRQTQPGAPERPQAALLAEYCWGLGGCWEFLYSGLGAWTPGAPSPAELAPAPRPRRSTSSQPG